MTHLKLFSLLFGLTLLVGCASSEPRSESSKFEFEYEGTTYEIVGLISPDGESLNDLVLRDGREIIFWARDNNQDGEMDRVMRGDISLEEANRIYQAGIQIAERQGKYQQQRHPRTFEFADDEYIYILVSVIGEDNNSYNIFVTINIETDSETELRDSNMDGRLNENQAANEEYIQWQSLYEMVLERGIDENRIDLTEEGRYIVRVNREITRR
ncbi:hypothetical protein [Rhodohalobacter halophilus]|uniref:hypothetical protein n=1 Tax=Rhodohalobacter halophilus TaxID=1812810 RepID=UPI00114CC165|nr:hypothetical protein [Rhodohalobacter halophilus]